MPGGGVEKGETFEAAAKRKIFEELGLSITKMSDLCEINSESGREEYYFSYLPDDTPLEIKGEEKEETVPTTSIRRCGLAKKIAENRFETSAVKRNLGAFFGKENGIIIKIVRERIK